MYVVRVGERMFSLLVDVTLSVFELHSSILTTDLREDKELGKDNTQQNWEISRSYP